MGLGNILGRLLLALIFIGAGVDKLTKGPEATAAFLNARYPVFHKYLEKSVGQQLPEILVTAVIEVLGGILVILNSSFGAFLLQVFLIQTILIIHNPFLFKSTPQEEQAESIHMLKNLAILGGLMLVGQSQVLKQESKQTELQTQTQTKKKPTKGKKD